MEKQKIIDLILAFSPLLIVVYCAVGVIPILKYQYIDQEPFLWTFKFFGPPVLFVILYGRFKLYKSHPIYVVVADVFQSTLKAFFITLMTTGYILLINDYLGGIEQECVEGVIQEKKRNSSSFLVTDYSFKLKDQLDTYYINVSKSDFEAYKNGDRYRRCLSEGFLGIKYSKL